MTMSDISYSMPPEWAEHDSTWLSWPHKEASWPGKFEPVPDVFAEIAALLCRYETVNINVLDDAMKQDASRRIRRKAGTEADVRRIRFHFVPTDDAWCRDHGPNYVFATGKGPKRKVIVDWNYNAWGGKYEPYDSDDSVPEKVASIQDIGIVKPGMVLEGGAIDVNGRGLLLTTEACLLNPNRNPSMTRDEIEARLMRFLGVSKVLWLGDGILGDDTDGHVDDIARFVDDRTVVVAVEDDPLDENYGLLQDNYRRLLEFTDTEGRPLRVVKLPMPEPVYYDNERLPASYANFYIANRQVLVPLYRSSRDEAALDTLRCCFPSREVVGIDCTDLIWGLGAIHCVTHEEPLLG